LPETASCADLRTLLTPLAGHASIAQTISRMDRLRRAHGQAVTARRSRFDRRQKKIALKNQRVTMV
jgi:hypothetical protein